MEEQLRIFPLALVLRGEGAGEGSSAVLFLHSSLDGAWTHCHKPAIIAA